MSPNHLSSLKAIHLSPSLAGGVRLSICLQFIRLPLQQLICQSGWWCPALQMSPISFVAIHLSPSLVGGVRLWMSPVQSFPLIAIHLSPSLAGGSPFVSLYSNSFASQCGWWCPALRMSAIDLSPIIAIADVSNSFVFPYSNSYVSLAVVWLSGYRLPVTSKVSQLLPWLLHLLSSLPPVSPMWSPSCLLDVSQMRLLRCCLPVAPKVSALVGESSSCRQDVVSQLSPTCGFPGVVSQLFPTLLHLLSSLPPVSQMWSPSCLPDVVS